MEKQILFAEVNTKNYKGIYKVVEFVGRIVALEINGNTTDFTTKEIERFCNEDGTNIIFKPNN